VADEFSGYASSKHDRPYVIPKARVGVCGAGSSTQSSCLRNVIYVLAARSKAWVCCRLPAEIAGSNPTWSMVVCHL